MSPNCAVHTIRGTTTSRARPSAWAWPHSSSTPGAWACRTTAAMIFNFYIFDRKVSLPSCHHACHHHAIIMAACRLAAAPSPRSSSDPRGHAPARPTPPPCTHQSPTVPPTCTHHAPTVPPPCTHLRAHACTTRSGTGRSTRSRTWRTRRTRTKSLYSACSSRSRR